MFQPKFMTYPPGYEKGPPEGGPELDYLWAVALGCELLALVPFPVFRTFEVG